MQSIYSAYECRICRKECILLTKDVEQITRDKYIACPYYNSKRVDKGKSTNDLRECMKERSYIRIKGALRQK
jgi:DNA-directed RNA polymerase subunit RPC12/RpoP